ncbi:MAG: hypothetical protein RR205_05235 [Oscillospiraceae bacterium]
MPYITYDEYFALGGKAEPSAFPILERLAEKKLDYLTQNRIVETTEDIKLAMVLIINLLNEMENGDKVSSFSNDGINVSFEKTDDLQNLHSRLVEILPQELTYLGVER